MSNEREAFEYEAGKALSLPVSIIEQARNGDRYDHDFDSMSLMQPLNGWWHWWQAGREGMESKLTKAELKVEDLQSQLTALTSQLESVVAENAALKAVESNLVRNIINDLGDTEFQYAKVQNPATDSFLAEVRASVVPDEATERELYEGWVMENHCISKSTLEGLRTCDGYRNSTLSGKDYNGMWLQWKLIRAAMLQGKAEQGCKVPDGWVMVPVEPTEDMCNVSHIGVDVYTGLARDDEYYSIGGVCAAKVYRAMLASAPQQESE